MTPRQNPDNNKTGYRGARGRFSFLLACILIMIAVTAGNGAAVDPESPARLNIAHPDIVQVGVYVMDFKTFSVSQGTVEADFYLTLKSGSNISLNDIEIINGQVTSVDTLLDTPHEKNYRIFADLTADPDFRLYPFDRHSLAIAVEPKTRNTDSLVLVINNNQSGLDSEANLPGWMYTWNITRVVNHSYDSGETPYSRADFEYGIQRDTASTILKFFLPIMLIIIVSLSSLMMKSTSRLGLNASMFLAAVLIHWRIADGIPLVAYATFLDSFMIITYATLVMVLISGILILRYTEMNDIASMDRVYRWSIRLIPAISILCYVLLFARLFV